MSTRLPPEVTDPSFRIGQSTTLQGPGAVGAPGTAALPDDDEPTARSMALNFADEPVERPALENTNTTRPTSQQLVKEDVQAREGKTNKSAELRHDLNVAGQKRKEKFQAERMDVPDRKTLTLELPVIKPNVTVPVVELFMK